MEMRRRFMKEKLLTPPNICTMLRIVGTVGLLLIRPLTLPFLCGDDCKIFPDSAGSASGVDVVLYRCGTGDPCLLLCYSRCAVSPVCVTAYDSEQGDRFLCLLSAVYACAGFCTEVL